MPEPEPTALYRLYDAEEDLLYIGISGSLEKRFKAHEHGHTWWHCVKYVDLTWFETFEKARAAEKAAHRSERPPYNGLGHVGLGWDGPAVRYDDRADQAAVRELLLSDLRAGTYPPGKHLWALTLSRKYGYSRLTTDKAMTDLARDGYLISRAAGYNVAAFKERNALAQRADGCPPPPRTGDTHAVDRPKWMETGLHDPD